MYRVQDHIHLGLTVSEVGEKAPVYTWKITDRPEVPKVFMSVNYALTGALRAHTKRVNGEVLQLTDMNLIVLVRDEQDMTTWQRKALLKSFQGNYLYYVDSFHPDDGEDHSPVVWRMYCSHIGEFKPHEQMLRMFYVEVALLDAHTVT
jgi:hypothetical protein